MPQDPSDDPIVARPVVLEAGVVLVAIVVVEVARGASEKHQ
jgi:hypothetical protein